jgi:predicted AAA+ superfamily ATPase
LAQWVSELQLQRQVILAGFRTDLPAVLPCLDLLVHPALMEGLGIALLQAASAGLPIVAANAGGMPEAVANWLETERFSKTDELHQSLLQNYKHDFGKYGSRINVRLLEKCFNRAPGLVGGKFKYSHIDRQINSRDVKKSLGLLIKAHVIHKIISTSGAGLPLGAHCNEKFFKILFLDVGLLQNAMGISKETYLSDNLLAVYKGLVAEQFVGQQLQSLKKPYEEPLLYYWQREARGSTAEVDYLWQSGERILPVEVKAGKTGTLKSLRLFLMEKEAPFGIRFSLHPLSFSNCVLSIPLYCIEAMPGLVDQMISTG